MAKKPALKICGITRQSDLDACVRLGVEYAGFNFYRGSTRYVQPEMAARLWNNRLNSKGPMGFTGPIRAAAVVVNPSRVELQKMIEAFPELEVIQFHGFEPDDLLLWAHKNLPKQKIWRAVPFESPRAVEQAMQKNHGFPIELLLIDAAGAKGGGNSQDVFGGSGHRFDWSSLLSIHQTIPIGIAGGIRPELIESLMTICDRLDCRLIDLASGVELEPGIKDEALIERVVARISAGAICV